MAQALLLPQVNLVPVEFPTKVTSRGGRGGLDERQGYGMPQRWQVLFVDRFWDALLTLPAWPASCEHILEVIATLARTPLPGESIPGTVTYVAKTTLILGNDNRVRLTLDFTRDLETRVLTMLFVDDFDKPRDPTFFGLPPTTRRSH